jgi:peptidoglycan-associated lipoprotein
MTLQTPLRRARHFAVPLVAALAVLAGCSSTRLAESPVPASTGAASAVTAAAAAQRPAPAVPAPAVQSTVRTVTLHPLDDPKSGLLKRTVYFDFDSFVIHDDDRPVIDSHARYLSTSRTAKLRIEGHADERGGREYNLALGQKRAQAVLKSLQLLGAPQGEMEATSFGKERPADPGHDEVAWARNRRADLNYLAR